MTPARILIAQKKVLFKHSQLPDLLKKLGHQVVAETDSGEACLTLYRELKPDIVVLDLNLVNGSLGFAQNLLRRLREENPPAWVVVCGEKSQTYELDSLKQGGAWSRILKPYDYDTVKSTINTIASRRAGVRKPAAENLVMLQHPDDGVRKQITALLEEDGYTVSEANSLFPSPIWCARMGYYNVKPALVITYRLDVLRALRGDDPNAVIMLCVDPDITGDKVKEALQLGASDLLVVPVSPPHLRQKVRDLCALGGVSSPGYVPRILRPETPPQDAGSSTAGDGGPTAGARILAAQRSDFLLAILRGILTKSGYDVVGEAIEGQHCLELYRELKPDLVVMDCVLANLQTGGQNGLETLHLLQEEDPASRVLMIGPGGESSVAAHCAQLGAAGYLTTPISGDKLRDAVEQVLHK